MDRTRRFALCAAIGAALLPVPAARAVSAGEPPAMTVDPLPGGEPPPIAAQAPQPREQNVRGSSSGSSSRRDASGDPFFMDPVAIVETSRGTVRVRLYVEIARMTARNFMTLAGNGWYDGVTFRRGASADTLEAGEMRPEGEAPETIPLESPGGISHYAGALAMVKSGRASSSGYKFYVVTAPGGAPSLNGRKDCVFGQIIDGLDVATQLQPGDKIRKVTILDRHGARFVRSSGAAIQQFLHQSVGDVPMVVKIVVHADGSADYSVERSCGNAQTDEAVLGMLRREWVWEPAVIDNKPVESTIHFGFSGRDAR